jgi:hypothetical protein
MFQTNQVKIVHIFQQFVPRVVTLKRDWTSLPGGYYPFYFLGGGVQVKEEIERFEIEIENEMIQTLTKAKAGEQPR